MEKKTISDGSAEWVLPLSVPYLRDEPEAKLLFSSLRWADGTKCCPRCESQLIYTVNTDDGRELVGCRECRYNFNSRAGTMFHAANLPINKIFQFLVVLDVYGDDLAMLDICFILGSTYATAKKWKLRGPDMRSPVKFTGADRGFARTLQSSEVMPDGDDFFPFCEMRGIVVNEHLMLEYIRWLCQLKMPAREKLKRNVSG